ncbi:reverse transcriptase domain-containing protein [Tanacetum coccineum]
MTLELANRSVAYPAGIAEDVFVQVGKFMFPADFVVVDYDVDPHVPFILGRPFLKMTRALVDEHREELTLRVGDEKLIFNVESISKYPRNHGDESINKIDILDTTCEDYFHEVFLIWKTFGRTRDLGSFGEETDKTTDLHQHLLRMSLQWLETASQIQCDAVTTMIKTASPYLTAAS